MHPTCSVFQQETIELSISILIISPKNIGFQKRLSAITSIIITGRR